MMDKVLLIVSAQDMDASKFQVSDLDDVKINREIDQLVGDVVLRPGNDTPFSQKHLTNWMWMDQLKIQFSSTKNGTGRTPLQQHQSLRDRHDLQHCWEVVSLEQE